MKSNNSLKIYVSTFEEKHFLDRIIFYYFLYIFYLNALSDQKYI